MDEMMEYGDTGIVSLGEGWYLDKTVDRVFRFSEDGERKYVDRPVEDLRPDDPDEEHKWN